MVRTKLKSSNRDNLLVSYVTVLDLPLLLQQPHSVEQPEGETQHEYEETDQATVQVQPVQIDIYIVIDSAQIWKTDQATVQVQPEQI